MRGLKLASIVLAFRAHDVVGLGLHELVAARRAHATHQRQTPVLAALAMRLVLLWRLGLRRTEPASVRFGGACRIATQTRRLSACHS